MGFCSIGNVESLTRMEYNTNTQPTSTQVQEWIDIFSNEIENILTERGIPVPGTSDKFYSTLTKIVSFAVAGIILNQSSSEQNNIGNYYFEEYKNFIQDVSNGEYDNQRTSVSSNQIIDGKESKETITRWDNYYDY